MKTHTTTFSFGTIKNATLHIPTGPTTLGHIVDAARKSYFEYALGRGLISDEVLTSSIGKSNFFEGVLAGYESRVTPNELTHLKSMLTDDDIGQAVAVVKFRSPELSKKEVYHRASSNRALSDTDRRFFENLAAMEA
jgi:hypothetical protein